MLNTSNTLSINLTTGVLTPSDPISIRATLTITLTNYGSLTSSNMRAALYRLNRTTSVDGTLVATANTFTSFVGAMSLNTTEIVASFTDCESVRQGERLRFDLLVWDITSSYYTIWDHLDCVYEAALTSDATAVSPIGTSTTTWGNLKLSGSTLYIYNTSDGLYYPLTSAGATTEAHLELGTGIPL